MTKDRKNSVIIPEEFVAFAFPIELKDRVTHDGRTYWRQILEDSSWVHLQPCACVANESTSFPIFQP